MTSNNRQMPAWFAARMAFTSRFTRPMFRIDFTTDEGLSTLALPMTLSAYVSGAASARHSTTVENSPSPSRLSTSYGPTRVAVSKESAGTQGGSASCWAHVLSKSVWLPWRYLGSSFLRTDDMGLWTGPAVGSPA